MAAKLLSFRGRGESSEQTASPPEGAGAGDGPKARPGHRPILPPSLLRAEERNAALRWGIAHAAHSMAFHGLRAPKYAARLVVYSPRGAWRAVSSAARWLFDAEGLQVQRHALGSLAAAALGHERSQHTQAYRSLAKEHAHRVKTRLFAVIAVFFLTLAFLPRVIEVPPVAVALAIGLAGWHGRRRDRPIVDTAVIESPGARAITGEMVIQAFTAAGLGTEKDPITFAAPGVHREGDGFAARIFLPMGTTVSKAVEKKEVIAAGLDVAKVQVFMGQLPAGPERSERRLALWVANSDPYAAKPPVTPLARLDSLDYWKPWPFGLDAKGKVVDLSLMFSGMLFGAKTRMGKTFAARLPVAAAALDPNPRLYICNGKGDNAWVPFASIAHWYASGVRTPVVRALAEMLKGLVDEMNRRNELIEKLPLDRCPNSQLTPALAHDRRLNMAPIVVAIDEVQRYLEDTTPAWEENGPRGKKPPTLGELIRDALIDLAKVGSSMGIILILATQDPTTDILPSGIRGQLGTRMALKVRDFQASQCILGTGTAKKGWDASQLENWHKGVGWLIVDAADNELADADAQIVRTHFMDGLTLQKIVERAREVRVKAGTLTGYAAGESCIEEPEVPARRLLDDVRAVFGLGESKLWSETIAARLAEAHPETYSGWTATDVGTMLARHGVRTRDVWLQPPDGKATTRKGIPLEALEEALQ